MENLKENLKDIWKPIDDFIDNFIRGIKNVWRWTPIIWKDRDFDYHYFWNVMHFKLHCMEKFFKNDKLTWCEGAERRGKEIEQCRKIVERLKEDDYSYWYNKHLEKWGELRTGFEPCYDEKTGDINPEFCLMTFFHKNVITQEDKKKESEEVKKAWKKDDEMKKRDLHNLCHLIEQNVDDWWD